MTTIATTLAFVQQALPPGTESWGEKYGVIGAVAALALAALGVALTTLLRERKADREKATKDDERHEKLITELNAKMVEIVRESSKEVTERLTVANSFHEQRYNLLLQRYLEDIGRAHETIRLSNTNNQETMAQLARKLRT